MKLYLLFVYIFVFCLNLHAQNTLSNANDILINVFGSSNKKIKGGSFIGQIVKGKCSGMGATLYKDKSIYIGDYYRDCIQGYGMLISSDKDDIANCPNCRVFIGNFKDGKKEGYGKCYNKNGIIIYEGEFANDKPNDTYPKDIINTSRTLRIYDLNNKNYFIGEYKDDNAFGFGVFVLDNGTSLWQSSFKNGQREGVGLYIASNGEWQAINIEDGQATIISSSEHYKEIEAINKANFKKGLSEALGYFSQALNVASQITSNVKQIKEGESITTNAYSLDAPSISNLSSNASDKYDLEEQNSYNNDKRTWGNYDNMLAAHFAGNRPATKNEVKQWQQKMNTLRAKWTSKGKKFPNSSNENKSILGCAADSHSH